MEDISNETTQNQSNDFWQAEVLGQIYDTSFAEMTEWIAEGSLTRTDKVRRGNLRWLEAGKVPPLIPFFNAKEQGIEPPQVFVSVTVGENPATENNVVTENFQPPNEQPFSENTFPFQNETIPQQPDQIPETDIAEQPQLAGNCVLHPEDEAVFYCETCASVFCPQCPKGYGGTVKICPMCGAMCKKIGEKDVKKEKEIQFRQAIGEGFGLKDIGKAFAYPLKFKSSFIIGGIMFMLFTLGQSAGALGGMFLMFSALFCFLLSNMLGFGILANTIENFSKGNLESNFMPGFEDFNLWDDVIHPFFLAVGTYLVSFGLFILVLILGIYFLVSSMTEQMNKPPATENASATSPYLVDEKKALNQSEEVKKLLEGVKTDAKEKKNLTESGLNDQTAAPPISEEQEFEELNRMIQQGRKQELESVVGKTEETKQEEYKQVFSAFMEQGAVILLLTLAALLWGIFYFPAACAVAGYTRSFWATVNPSVGIDTIKTLGGDYFKIFGVYILLMIASVVVGIILNVVFLAFALPGMGNLPATAILSWFNFYTIIVFSCILGFALFKNSDKFKFYRG